MGDHWKSALMLRFVFVKAAPFRAVVGLVPQKDVDMVTI